MTVAGLWETLCAPERPNMPRVDASWAIGNGMLEGKLAAADMGRSDGGRATQNFQKFEPSQERQKRNATDLRTVKCNIGEARAEADRERRSTATSAGNGRASSLERIAGPQNFGVTLGIVKTTVERL